jgi:hypothetical protein
MVLGECWALLDSPTLALEYEAVLKRGALGGALTLGDVDDFLDTSTAGRTWSRPTSDGSQPCQTLMMIVSRGWRFARNVPSSRLTPGTSWGLNALA